MIYFTKNYLLQCVIVFTLWVCVSAIAFSQEVNDKSNSTSKYKFIEGPNVGHEPSIPKKYTTKFSKDIKDYKLPWLLHDRNTDGVYDIVALISKRNFLKEVEILDMDFDGILDDFSFFDENGKLSYQIIDHNKDGKADLWIQIKNGRFIQRFQRDKDGDGIVDVDRIFDFSILSE